MNWKLIGLLSLFGLAMGVGTVSMIPSRVEPWFWLVAFLLSAYSIGMRADSAHFLHGLLVGLANSVWVTGAHVLMFDRYIANHPEEAAMMTSMPLTRHPRVMMAIVGPMIGLASGLVLGFLALVASRLLAARRTRLRPHAQR